MYKTYFGKYFHSGCKVIKAISLMGIYFVLIKYLHNKILDEILYSLKINYICLSVLCVFSADIRVWLAQKQVYQLYKILFWISPVGGFFLIEKIYNPNINKITWLYMLGNIICLMIILICVNIICASKRIAMCIYWSILFVFALTNYYVTQFRGNPFMPSDLFSVVTAARVAGRYTFAISDSLVIGVLYYFWNITLAMIVPYQKRKRERKHIIAFVLYIIAVIVCFRNYRIEEIYGFQLTDMQWDIGSVYQEKGSVLSFATMLQNYAVDKPKGYHKRLADQILDQFHEETCYKTDTQPTIIAIMNESFSDLRVLGDFETSEAYLHNWYNIDDYILRGNLYVSTYAGGTANTEFEFLTGNSMGNLPAGIVPYQIYNLKNIGNMTDILNRNGYITTAIHPEYKGNWTRTRVYESFGFDTFLSIDNFESPERIHDSVSDRASFDKVIEVFESSDCPQFIFNVTMQNHGGYDINKMSGFELVELKEAWRGFSDVETYLTLIRESDKAIGELLEYFRTVDKPVIVCIFGDHQPGVNGVWIEEVMGKTKEQITFEEQQRKYCVPYMIWANYDTKKSPQILNTSSNYLGALLLDQAGINRSDYMKFLVQMQKEIPICNAFGYQTNDEIWHSFDEETEVSEWIQNYKIVQYNAIFDAKRNKKYYVPNE